MEKDNKSLIIFIAFLGLLLVGLGGYIAYDKFIADNNNDEKESINNKKESTENDECITDKSKRKYCLTTNLYFNDNEYEELEEKIKFSFTLPEGYYLRDNYLEDDAIVDDSDNKIGINPFRPTKLSKGQKMPTKLSDLDDPLDEDWISNVYDSEYFTQNGLQIFLTHSEEVISGYSEGDWSQVRYLRRFWINKDDIVFTMTFFTTEKNMTKEELDSLKQSAASFKIYE